MPVRCEDCRFCISKWSHGTGWLECARHAPVIIPAIESPSVTGHMGYYPRCGIPCGDFEKRLS